MVCICCWTVCVFFFSSRRRHTRCALVTGVQTCALPISLDFRYAIGLVTLVDVERDPLRFRFRLAASPVTRHLGYELTGRYLDEVPERDMRRDRKSVV